MGSPKKLKPLDLSGDDPLDQDLSEYLARKELWRPGWMVFALKDRTVTLRLPSDLVVQVKALAKGTGFRYQALMRQYIAAGLIQDQTALKAKGRKRAKPSAKTLIRAA